MSNSVAGPFRASADYMHIDVALKSLWQPFIDLVAEMDSFVPRPLADYDTERRAQFDQYRGLNPHLSDEFITKFVDEQIAFAASMKIQFSDQFSSRFMAQYVMVAVLSHALCEAAINAILAMGLAQAGSHDFFSIIEKADVKEKWRLGPKSFSPGYELKPDTAIFATLNHLIKRRNALVHNKINLHVGDKKLLEGSRFDSLTFQENERWMRRFFSLPYDLVEQANLQWNNLSIFVLHDRSPITKADVH